MTSTCLRRENKTDWVALFPWSQHFNPLNLKFLHTAPIRARELGANIIGDPYWHPVGGFKRLINSGEATTGYYREPSAWTAFGCLGLIEATVLEREVLQPVLEMIWRH